MKKGNYYWIEQNDSKNRIWIIKCADFQDGGIYGSCICLTDKDFYRHNPRWGSKGLIKNSRLAAPEEIAWLDACIAANEFVPQPVPVIINSYEIY